MLTPAPIRAQTLAFSACSRTAADLFGATECVMHAIVLPMLTRGTVVQRVDRGGMGLGQQRYRGWARLRRCLDARRIRGGLQSNCAMPAVMAHGNGR